MDAGPGAYRLAVDLGTCHTVAVVRRGDEPPRALLFDGSPLLPSGVYAQRGDLYVGRDAERMSLLDPASFEPYPKRRVDEGTVLLGDAEVPVVDLLAAVLKRVVAEAGGSAAGGAVLTCPADWGPPRRALLRSAAQVAGLAEVRLVDEPVAAATYCERVLGRAVAAGQSLAVFDFGGGTLDVTVVRRDPDALRVLAVGGLDDLGGVDVDAALVGHLGQLVAIRTPEVWRRLSAPAGPPELRDRRAFWGEVRGAKEMLSRAAAAPVQVPGTEEALHLTREELERVAGPLVDRAVDETRRVLQRAGVLGPQLAGILLVGGSSRIPLVASRLHARFGLPPTVPEQPELPVAYGALLAAAGLAAGAAAAVGAPGPAGAPAPPAAVVGPISGPGVGAAPVSPPAGYLPTSGPPVPVSPVSPVSGSPFAAEQASPPGGYPMPSPAVRWPPPPTPVPANRPPARPARGPLRAILVSLVLLAVLGGTVYTLVTTVVTNKTIAGTLGGGNRGSGGGTNGGNVGGGAALTPVGQPVALPGQGATTVTADATSVYYAGVGTNQTTVTAVPVGGGPARWTANVHMEPTGVRLTVVGPLLLLDGERSGTDGGKNVRAVLDVAKGGVHWQGLWEDKLDVAFVGTDEIVETRGRPLSTARVDLLTGKAKWTRPGPDDLVIIDQRRVGAALAWPSAPNAATVPPPGDLRRFGAAAFREGLATDQAAVVDLDENTGKGSVLDPASGHPKVTGDVQLDIEKWTVFDGMVVGKANDKLSPGRDTIVAYRLDTLALAWQAPQPAGSSIEVVRPCGPHVVCAGVEANGGGKTVTGFGTADGKQRWQLSFDGAVDEKWYVLGGQLVMGDGPFDNLNEAVVVNNGDGKVAQRLDPGTTRQYTVVAGDGNRMALSSVLLTGAGSTVHWQVQVQDLGSGSRSAGVDIGDKLPKYVSLVGGTLMVITESRQLRILRVPGAPGASPALK